MKKVMFVLAVAGMFAFAACNNNATETTEDTTAPEATEEVVAEEPVAEEEAVAEEAVAEEAAPATEEAAK